MGNSKLDIEAHSYIHVRLGEYCGVRAFHQLILDQLIGSQKLRRDPT